MELSSQRNSSDIIFVCDFYKSDLNNKGGAENNDSVLISLLSNLGYNVVKKYCKDINLEFVEKNKDSTFIIGNFISLSEDSKRVLKNSNYIIYEHDHKYLKTRDPSKFINFKAPQDQVINKDFYQNATSVICLSNSQASSVRNNLEIDNVESIGCSLWSSEKLDYIASISNTKKTKKCCIVNSSNPTKGTSIAQKYCDAQNIKYDLIESNNEKEFLNNLSAYETLIFIPTVLESLCRLAVEAKMLNCSLVTKPSLIGASSEDWWDLKGDDLIKKIKSKQEEAVKIFLKHL